MSFVLFIFIVLLPVRYFSVYHLNSLRLLVSTADHCVTLLVFKAIAELKRHVVVRKRPQCSLVLLRFSCINTQINAPQIAISIWSIFSKLKKFYLHKFANVVPITFKEDNFHRSFRQLSSVTQLGLTLWVAV